MIVRLPRIDDPRGSLTVAERLSFDVRRAYWLHDLAPGAVRGGHAHKALHRLLIAVSGGFRARVDRPGGGWGVYPLDNPSEALYVPPMAWLDLAEFSPGAVCLVLASAEYDAEDYIRDRAEWQALTRAGVSAT